ncbi:MAG: SGNH/GDSL hydrolase family protein [Balneolaceae bacterium]
MKYNIRESHTLYRDNKYTGLLKKILEKFRDEAAKRGHVPLVLVMPQLLDLELAGEKDAPYEPFYREVDREHLPVLDLTPEFRKHSTEKLYIDDRYGGHLSAEGNRIVAKALAAKIRSLGGADTEF